MSASVPSGAQPEGRTAGFSVSTAGLLVSCLSCQNVLPKKMAGHLAGRLAGQAGHLAGHLGGQFRFT